MILLDTNAVLFLLREKHRLSPRAVEAIAGADIIAVSSISIWEIGLKFKIGKLPLPFSPEEMVYHLRNVYNLVILPVDEQMWLKNLSLNWDNKDPADRTIVATAMLKGVPLVSSDRLIQEFYSNTVW